jgi:hypothetical protein
MRPWMWMFGAGLLASCTDGSQRCDELIPIWEDLDGDHYGGKQLADACGLVEGETGKSLKGLDCDDNNPDIHPKSDEICDGIDNDCDGQPDNGMDTKQWYADEDGDSFGAQYPTQLACEAPGDGWVTKEGDCDDTDPSRHPDAEEVCGGVDEDCDGFEGDYDESVDIGTFNTYYQDNDGDGLGAAGETGRFCRLQPRYSDNDLDCDDTDELIGQFRFYTDADGDGYGNPDLVQLACSAPNGTVKNNLDCDDDNSAVNIDKLWYLDEDLDGFGSRVPIAYQCAPPVPEAVVDHEDCDDADSGVHPGVPEVCLDGIDQDCSGEDECRTCLEYFLADPELPSGAYSIIPDGVTPQRVYCDMETDGGGWTLVASNSSPPGDYAMSYHQNLATINPSWGAYGVWNGMSDIAAGNSDIRFACKRSDTAPQMAVDLSFYDIHWYEELTASPQENQVCFNQATGGGANSDPPPARRNNLTDDFLPAGDPWNAGYLVGEDSCGDGGDFTIDFDDRGADGNESDGTDWGYDDYDYKCGYIYAWSSQFFIFVREIP